jgi:hypothetical protein
VINVPTAAPQPQPPMHEEPTTSSSETQAEVHQPNAQAKTGVAGPHGPADATSSTAPRWGAVGAGPNIPGPQGAAAGAGPNIPASRTGSPGPQGGTAGGGPNIPASRTGSPGPQRGTFTGLAAGTRPGPPGSTSALEMVSPRPGPSVSPDQAPSSPVEAAPGSGTAGPAERTAGLASAGPLQFMAAGLLDRGDALRDLLEQARAPGEAAQAESRLRSALPIALDAIDLSLGYLAELQTGQFSNAYDVDRRASALNTIMKLDLAALAASGARRDAGIAPDVIGELKESLDRLASIADPATTVEQARNDLARLRDEINAAKRDLNRPLSISSVTDILTAVLRITTTVAIGLLSAASTALMEGGSLLSSLIAAAVGLAVSALATEACRTAVALRRPPAAARLAEAHDSLQSTIGDLSSFLRRLEPADAEDPEHDLALVRDTQFAAVADAYHARDLALALNWPRSQEYAAAVEAVTSVLGDIPGALGQDVGASQRTTRLPDLAARLTSAAESLAGFSVPADAHVHDFAPREFRTLGDRLQHH